MKSKKQQNQLDKVIRQAILIVLLALLVVLGFIIWKGFNKEGSDLSGQTQLADAPLSEVQSTLTLSEWGVEMLLSQETINLSVDRLDDTDSYSILVPASVLFDDGSQSTATQEVGRIQRFAASTPASDVITGAEGDETIGEVAARAAEGHHFVQVGDYVYQYVSRQAAAFAGENDAEIRADEKLLELASIDAPGMFNTLRAAN